MTFYFVNYNIGSDATRVALIETLEELNGHHLAESLWCVRVDDVDSAKVRDYICRELTDYITRENDWVIHRRAAEFPTDLHVAGGVRAVGVGLQQDAGPHQQASGVRAGADQAVERLPLLASEPDRDFKGRSHWKSSVRNRCGGYPADLISCNEPLEGG
ncbi:hypothetical protein [Alienimonas chondri]|uniref:Uncharacterized protein n=1 Tax=Alienimonas chondri TaxID=2681879 RepID=A0ABX1VCY6_9PLAN|nr:hypothetical protein [Alienimonas chondri]NNJ25785.1 hypothetical protein [Alienimonas chondri]